MHTDWSLFFGRFHPLIVHIPIGIILFAAILNTLAAYKKSILIDAGVNIALLTGAIGAALAAISGYFLSSGGGYDSMVLLRHKWAGIFVALFTFFTWLIRKNRKADISILQLRVSTWLLLVCIVLITIGGHLGGKMTHGEGYLTRYMPAFLEPVFGSKKRPTQKKIIPILDSAIVFNDIIQPILNERCTGCHNASKMKGELDLTSIATIIKGGKSGNTIIAGDIEKSELVHRITLPMEHKKFMPADNRPPLTPIEIHLIKWWIETGADDKKNITAAGADEKTKHLLAVYLGINAESDKEIQLPEVLPADSITLERLREKIIIRSLSSKSNQLAVSFVSLQQATPVQVLSALEELAAIKDQVYRLDISNCGLNKDGLKIIAGFTRLNKLEIQKNNLTDNDIDLLLPLQHLELLNAGQNPLTDKSVVVFKKLTGLKKLNLWQTKVSETGITDLQSQLQKTVIDY